VVYFRAIRRHVQSSIERTAQLAPNHLWNFAKAKEVPCGSSGDSKGGPGWAMATPDFCLAPCLALQFFSEFPVKFLWLTYTVA